MPTQAATALQVCLMPSLSIRKPVNHTLQLRNLPLGSPNSTLLFTVTLCKIKIMPCRHLDRSPNKYVLEQELQACAGIIWTARPCH